MPLLLDPLALLLALEAQKLLDLESTEIIVQKDALLIVLASLTQPEEHFL